MLRTLCVTAVALVMPAGFAGAQVDCSQAVTQLEMNDCARARWQVADNALNAIWAVAKPQADAGGWGAELLDAQRKWLAFRDAHCAAEMAPYQGGSIQPLIYWSCMDRMTLARNEDLRRGIR